MTRRADVLLHDQLVGELIEDEAGFITFRTTRGYQERAARNVIGQWFEDHPHRPQRGDRAGELPSFFANLIPEGDLRIALEDRLGLERSDDLAFLCAVGRDLPGAVVVQRFEGERDAATDAAATTTDTDVGYRFSLAGVQLKFSMLRTGARFCFAGRDQRGEWIAKVALAEYSDLCMNEWLTMEWARRCGFQVPETELVTLGDLVDVPAPGSADQRVFVIKRFDREPDRRVHQEDFQQIVGRRPHGKYDDITLEGLCLLADRIVGADAMMEMIRRIAFTIVSGNNDAHMKNWSVVYPDGVHATLSPLYDQVFTAQWSRFTVKMALKLAGTKEFAALDEARLRTFAERLRLDPSAVLDEVYDVVHRAGVAWSALAGCVPVPADYHAALRTHWNRVPILQELAASV